MKDIEVKALIAENHALKNENARLKKQYEYSLKTADILHEKFHQFVNIIPQAVFELDIDGRFVFLNPQGFKFFGYNQSECRETLLFWDLFNASDQEKIKTDAAKVFLGQCNIDGEEYTAVRKDGSTFYTLIYSCPISNQNNQKIHGLILDIDKRRKAEMELEQSRDQLRNLSTHLQSVREEERSYLAREIHDELGQALTALKMDLLWIDKRLTKKDNTLLEKTKSMTTLLDSTIQIIKKICSDLRPGLLDDLGLKAAMEWYTEEFIERTGILCKLNISFESLTADKDLETSVFRIFQETLTNVARHARATKVIADFKINNNIVSMTIKDNGIGISKEKINDPQSLGLVGLRERVFPWGGELIITGEKNKGTCVSANIPLKRRTP